jgi:hypothetical protein
MLNLDGFLSIRPTLGRGAYSMEVMEPKTWGIRPTVRRTSDTAVKRGVGGYIRRTP